MLRLKFQGKNLEDLDFWTKSDPYLTISRPSRQGQGQVQVRRTETIMNDLNPSWKLLYISTHELCDDNHQLPLTIEVYDEDRNSRDDFIGGTKLTLSDLMQLSFSGTSIALKKGTKDRGELLVTECVLEESTSDVGRRDSVLSYPPSRKTSSIYCASEANQHFEAREVKKELLEESCMSFPTSMNFPQGTDTRPESGQLYSPMPSHPPDCHNRLYPALDMQEDPLDTRPKSIWI